MAESRRHSHVVNLTELEARTIGADSKFGAGEEIL